VRTVAALCVLAALAACGHGVATSRATFTAHAQFTSTVATAADWLAPVVTLTAPADGSFTNVAATPLSGAAGTAAGDSPTVVARLYARTTATGTPVQTLNATRSGATWSATPVALADGTYTVQATQSDSAGNTGTSNARTFTVDTQRPNPVAVGASDGGTTPGRLGAGDTITFSYDDAIAPASVFPGWDGSAVTVRVHFTNGGTNPSPADRFTVQTSTGATTINLDSGVNTLANLVTGTVDVTATMTGSADGRSVSIVLASPGTTGVVQTAGTTKRNMTWTVKAGPTDRAGNALVVPPSAVAETDTDLDF
jgi:hypothetical protein